MEHSIQNKKFSLGKKLKSKNAQIDGETSLSELYNNVRNNNSLKCQTEKIRRLVDEKLYRAAKLEFPFVMPSGHFSERRKTALIAHSGFICIDIDKIKNVKEVVDKLKKLPFVAFMFVSPSGKGVKAFITIDIVAAEHINYFFALEKYFKDEQVIEIDSACKDVSRACLLAHDPNAYLNEDAKILSVDFVKQWGSISNKVTYATNSRALEDIEFNVTDVEISEEKKQQIAKRLLANAINNILNAPDGKKHIILRNKAVRLGYYAKYGIVDIHVAYDSLLTAISKRKVDNLAAAKNTVVSGIDFGVHNAPAFKALKLTNEPPMYVIGEGDKGDKYLLISYTKLYRFLNFHGFWVYKKAGIRVFIKVEDNIISRVDKHDVIGFVMQYIRALPWQLADGITRENLEEIFRKKMNVLFSENQLATLDLYYPAFNVDDPNTAYLYFSNGFLNVTKDTVQLLPYSQLDGVIWATQILDRSFTELGVSSNQLKAQSEFAKFILGVSNNREGKNSTRYESLISIIGYLLHRYKNPSYSKAIIFCDENISASPNGGAGKSIVLKALTKFRNTALIDGKNFSFKSQFAFQQVGLDTEMMVFEDVNLGFDFERLFSVITEGLSIEKKGQDRFSISFEESPKIAIITNYMISGNGNSHRRRKVEYEFSTFYNSTNTPRQEFGHNLYDDWQDEQWNLFDDYMVSCIQYFLKNGVVSPPKINISKRKLLQETSEEFLIFTETRLQELLNIEVSKQAIKSDFVYQFSEFVNHKWFTQRLFNRWLRIYADLFELECSERVSNNNQLILIKNK